MPSAWVTTRPTRNGGRRYRVYYRLVRSQSPKYGGSFGTRREATLRKVWVENEIASGRVPDLTFLRAPERAPTLAEAAERWKQSRRDVTEGTRTLHRVALDRVLPTLGSKRVDEITADDVDELVAALVAKGRKRGTIRKSITYLASVLDGCGLAENPARSKQVRLPHEDSEEPEPPTAEHIEAVYRLLAPSYRLGLLWLDWSGMRLASVELTKVGDYDEPARRIRQRKAITKTRHPLWVELPEELAEAIEAILPPREDRDPEASLFAGVGADALRTAIIRSCKAAGIPRFTPHDLRHRRISLLHRQGKTWAEIGRLVGQKKLSVTADTYTHVLSDGRLTTATSWPRGRARGGARRISTERAPTGYGPPPELSQHE
jgi:integrase